MNFTILIKLLPLFAFTYFVVLPVSLACIVEWTIHNWFAQARCRSYRSEPGKFLGPGHQPNGEYFLGR